MADTRRVFANPGTPSSRTWPSARRATTMRQIKVFCPHNNLLYLGRETLDLIDAFMEA
jgi:hypothetical protein